LSANGVLAAMSSPLPGRPGDAVIIQERSKLARRWAHVLISAAVMPVMYSQFERRLLDLVTDLCGAVVAEQHEPGYAAGARLVDMQCTGPATLQVSTDVIGRGLLDLSELRGLDRLTERVISALGAFGSGYAERMRVSALDQQEVLGQSITGAMRQAREGLRESEARFDELFSSSSDGVAITDFDGLCGRINNAFATILGRTATELDQPSLFELVHEDDVARMRAVYEAIRAGRTTNTQERCRLVRQDGELAWVSLRLSVLADHVMVIADDSTELRLLQGQLNRQLLHDALTWLPNRQFFSSQLEKALRTTDPVAGVSVIHLDLDAFSMVTGWLGRHAGDVLLKTVAERLTEVVADETAIVARFGGDEFAILVENATATPDVAGLVARIDAKLAEEVDIEGWPVATSASMGVVVHRPNPYSAAADLLEAADLALRRAKRTGPRQWELFDPAQDVRDRRMFSLALTMPNAWANGELRAVCQPVVQLATDQPAGLEARLAWQHPELGEVPHEECVGLATRTGLIVQLGHWLMHAACEHGQDVRVSLTQIQAADPGLAGATRRILDETGLRPDRLRIGVPLAATVLEDVVENIQLLAEEGVGIQVDDIGISTATLARIGDLPVRGLRLTHMEPESRDAPALRAMIALVHQAGIEVTVGDVNTRDQAEWWRRLGADAASGRHHEAR
jgi:diguanylate cyclase (GGDEF)-like protein/PAS domain S-box-containing protein